jgi:hypothetical protein
LDPGPTDKNDRITKGITFTFFLRRRGLKSRFHGIETIHDLREGRPKGGLIVLESLETLF